MEINISSDKCWKCNKQFSPETPKTIHHALPKHLQPKNNILIPLCQNCHDIITSNDMGALTTFSYAIKKSTDELSNRVDKLIKHIKAE